MDFPVSIEGALALGLEQARDGRPLPSTAPVAIARAIATHTLSQWSSILGADIPRSALDAEIADTAEAIAAAVARPDTARSPLQVARDLVAQARARYSLAAARWARVSLFVWRTRKDSRVRPEHAALDGKVFRFAQGAPGQGLPGEPYGCRCSAEPLRR